MNNPFLEQENNTSKINHNLSITEGAVNRLNEIFKDEEIKIFRVKISGGGCSGFQYNFDTDKSYDDNDYTIDTGDVIVAINKKELEYINNGEIDFVNSLAGQYFTINNPNAKSSCGCGTSFSM
ncbi:MAG: HesB/IscA family protein [Alphaproteobacteria bacterium]